MNGLTTVNIELSSKCNKFCWCCGRREIDRSHPEIAMNYGYMDFGLVESIAKQLPSDIVTQFHWNGEPLLYPKFGKAIDLFKRQIRCIDTNGKLLVEKADQIINKLDTLTVSIIENDPEGEEQYQIVRKFLSLKGNIKPLMIYRLLGDVNKPDRWKELPGIVATRVFHSALGSFNYQKTPTKPEIGICLDLLNHIAIDRFGNVSPCVRFDPLHLGRIGDLNKSSLKDIWNSSKRKEWIKHHLAGRRDLAPLCNYCDFWGIPTGY